MSSVKKPRKINFRQAFISKVLSGNINWPQENKIMSKLLKKYPEEGFWYSVELRFKIPSLAYFLTDKGAEKLSAQYKLFKFEPTKRVIYSIDESLETEPSSSIIENTTPKSKKVKSVKDFLTLWNKK